MSEKPIEIEVECPECGNKFTIVLTPKMLKKVQETVLLQETAKGEKLIHITELVKENESV